MNKNGKATKHESLYKRIDGFVSKYILFGGALILQKIAAISLLLLTLLTLVIVLGRRSPWGGAWLLGGLEISELLMANISIFAAAYCFYNGGHLRITFLRERVSLKAGYLLDALSSLLFAVWMGAVALGMWQMAITNISNNAKGWGLGIPIGPFMAAFFIAAALFFLVLLKDVLNSGKKLIDHNMEVKRPLSSLNDK